MSREAYGCLTCGGGDEGRHHPSCTPPKPLPQRLREAVVRLRHKAGITQEVLAKRAGIDVRSVKRAEGGTASQATCERLIEELGGKVRTYVEG